jgi:excisionase family DNA binding protein
MTSFLTVSQAAASIGVTRQYIQQLIDSEKIQAEWMLERWAIPLTEVNRIKRERQAGSPKSTNGNGHK